MQIIYTLCICILIFASSVYSCSTSTSITYTTKTQNGQLVITPQISAKISPNVPMCLNIPTNITMINNQYTILSNNSMTLNISYQSLIQPFAINNYLLVNAATMNKSTGCTQGASCYTLFICKTTDINQVVAPWNLSNSDITIHTFSSSQGTVYKRPSTTSIEMLIVIGDPFSTPGARCTYVLITPNSFIGFDITDTGMLTANISTTGDYNINGIYQIASPTKINNAGIYSINVSPYDSLIDMLPNNYPLHSATQSPCSTVMTPDLLTCWGNGQFILKGKTLDEISSCLLNAAPHMIGFIEQSNGSNFPGETLSLYPTNLVPDLCGDINYTPFIHHNILQFQYTNNGISAVISTDYNVSITLNTFSIPLPTNSPTFTPSGNNTHNNGVYSACVFSSFVYIWIAVVSTLLF